MSGTKPVIFISYSHKDRRWLEFVQGQLQVAVTNDLFETWDDRSIGGGADWEKDIDVALARCAAFILLVSANSLVSGFILKKEVKAALEAHWERGVRIYPIVVDPCDTPAVPWLMRMNLRPQDGKALSLYPLPKRKLIMASLAAEIRDIVNRAPSMAQTPVRVKLDSGRIPETASTTQTPVRVKLDYGRLPETAYEHLVGRGAELERLDKAWTDRATNIVSLVAEGGAGKSALVNEWLRRMQADSYRGAQAVLGWSFFSQGTKERATSADEFLNWALDRLGIKLDTTSSIAKGEAIAEALTARKVLLLLDGVEPLQYGPEGQTGQLKDQGLRALLRRFAVTAPADAHGLIVLTSRLVVTDIAGWKDSAAPVLNVEKLSDEAGAALLRDNGVRGTDKELQQASRDFGGHPLALGLLASFLKETQNGDIRRRDHIRALVAGTVNPGHDHAARVMESYETEWLAGRPDLLAIMQIVGLFDRPASVGCLNALRAKPVIAGLTDAIVALDEDEWQRAIARLREVRLLSPPDQAAPGALDAHPLLREWFGERLKRTDLKAWETAHGRLYEHLRDSTKEGDKPSLEQLAPLYQAITHGCRAGQHQEALNDVYMNRICKRGAGGGLVFYSRNTLGAIGSNLAAVFWFFHRAYEAPVGTLWESDKSWVLNEAALGLSAIGRVAEALPAMRASMRMYEEEKSWSNAAIEASNLSDTELLAGNVADAVASAETSITHANRSSDEPQMIINLTTLANVRHAAGRFAEADHLFADAERRHGKSNPQQSLLHSLQGYRYCDLLLAGSDYAAVRERAFVALKISLQDDRLLDIALSTLSLARAQFGLAATAPGTADREAARTARTRLDEAVDGLRTAGQSDDLPRGLLARAAFRRCIGDGVGTVHDLDEVEEIAEPGPMKLFLCDLALERARLAFARIEAFAPLNGMIDGSPPKPEVPGEEKRRELHDEAAKQIAIAADYIATCGYHRRDAELAELQAVLEGKRKFSDLPPRV